MRPLIGITTYAREEGWFKLPGEYIDAVRQAGGVPLLIAPGEGDLDRVLESIHGLLLSGGGDVDPGLYGGKPHEMVYMVDEERDRIELGLVRGATDLELPALCICRGMQVLNVAFGGTLIEHLPDEVGEDVLHRLPPREPIDHAVSVAEDSHLAELLGATSFVSKSWHHQAIREVAPGFVAVARAEDGTIEAIERPGQGALPAVQWHPELDAARVPVHQRLFDELIRLARERC
jgi:putative glutamine amidotransferase